MWSRSELQRSATSKAKIAEQQRLYSSLKGEIARLVAEQAAHQRALAAAARERLQ